MCGIAGVVGPRAEKSTERERVEALGLMQHRGPDASGEWKSPGVWLGHRRLAIIDLSPRGNQPMSSPDSRYVCILNGEIYNFRDVRSRLESLGVSFSSGSDTEVLVQAYAKWGVRVLESLDGMFAFAIWDDQTKQLVVARDRFGEKPLYYGHAADGFVFASDVKVVRALTGEPARIDFDALVGDLVYGYPVDTRTAFAGLSSLAPASYMRVDCAGNPLEQATYWKWQPGRQHTKGSYRAYLARLEDNLRVSIRRRLISDRPLGVLLSGGIDSSLTAAIVAQESGRSIDAFTVAFDDAGFDETPHARAVASHVGLRHHVLSADDDLLDSLPKLLWHYGVPFHDFSCIPTAAAFRAVSKESVVCLTGDGGDEMFAGYSEPLLFQWLAAYSQVPQTIRDWVRGACQRGGDGGRLGRRMAKWSRLGALPFDESFANIKDSIWNGAIPLRHAASADGRRAAFDRMAEAYRLTRGSPVHRYLGAHAATQFVNAFLVKVDVASMAYSVESRTPFLSPEIAELAARAPAAWLLRGGQQKRILRDLALKFLPADVVTRPKQGFTPPLRSWLRGSLKDPVERLLHPTVVERRGLFDAERVAQLVGSHMAGAADHTYPLWILASLEIWWRLFIDASASPEMTLSELSKVEPKLAIDDVIA
jgi:asparagine synthase (glutamine-hydrolysing)